MSLFQATNSTCRLKLNSTNIKRPFKSKSTEGNCHKLFLLKVHQASAFASHDVRRSVTTFYSLLIALLSRNQFCVFSQYFIKIQCASEDADLVQELYRDGAKTHRLSISVGEFLQFSNPRSKSLDSSTNHCSQFPLAPCA